MQENTLFDKILAGEIESDEVYSDEFVYAFRDINPQAPVHVLVIPKKKLSSFSDVRSADAVDLGEFMRGVSRVAEQLGLEDGGYRVVFNTGPDAQQTVQYLHAHVIGGRSLSWPPG
ncbi:MAG: HIT domain-containing protein [Spirochaetes bacterium]|jgi:histidine triad (HIT) family protein|nr:HIT domain-containing protein [Spirochaetota bacterium]